jgi:hypothetical protein
MLFICSDIENYIAFTAGSDLSIPTGATMIRTTVIAPPAIVFTIQPPAF